MTKKDIKLIKELADKLPATNSFITVRATGSQILTDERFAHIRRFPDFKPQEINPKSTYKVRVPEGTVNHLRRMREAFKKQGWKGVYIYLLPFAEQIKKAQENESKPY